MDYTTSGVKSRNDSYDKYSSMSSTAKDRNKEKAEIVR